MQALAHFSSIPVSAGPLPRQKHQCLPKGVPAYSNSSSPRNRILHIAAEKRFIGIEGLKQVYIPKIPIVLPAKIAPSYERNCRECDEWAVRTFHRFHTEEQKRCMKVPLLIHLCYPEGVDSRLLWASKLLIWFVIFDDDMDNMEQLGSDLGGTASCIQEYISVLEGEKVSIVDNDLLGIFATLWEEAAASMPPHHYARFRDDTMGMFQAILNQNKLRSEGQIPGSIDELLAARRGTGYFTGFTNLVEYMIGVDVDDEVKKAVDTAIADDYITLCNDILSLRGEYLNKDYHNVPCTIAILNNLSLDEAIRQTTDLVQGVVDRYNQVRDFLLQAHPASPQVKAYIDGLGYTMTGNLEWNWHTGRYHGPDWVAPQEREGIMHLNTGKNASFIPASAKFATQSCHSKILS